MIDELIKKAKDELREQFEITEGIALFNQGKVLDAFKEERIALRHFAPTTGYGYDSDGRAALCRVYARAFGAEKAVVSPNIVSGTHAISLGLFALLRPGDLFVSATGLPYDTLIDVISGDNIGSLKDYGVKFESIPLKGGKIDEDAVLSFVKERNPKMVYVQRSRGYDWRQSLSIEEMKNFFEKLRKIGFNGCIFVDNCYGEFVETMEPTDVGADVIAGSLIKNPGGGIAPTGGYVAGGADYIDLVENRLTAPSIGGEVGSYAFTYQYFFQGLFLAPHVVKQALDGSMLIGSLMADLGYKTMPGKGEIPKDITRSVMFDTEKELTDFIQSVQDVSPVDSFVRLEAWDMPGYDHKVIMAAGCFVQGSSIELSADAPICKPYIAYIQGGLTFEHCVVAARHILKKLSKN
ncbi:MAG: methionine gamma-lyase family protein [Clostridia bacterium]|nr:methionine gamma-lyase family protein [Clostridia bacterium]MBP5194316.1 methionine gamma-lyase family protein [Clostridia bacterium]